MPDHAILTSEAHRELRIRTERSAEYGDAVMACLIVPDEFRRVQEHYPILFQQNAERTGFNAVALFGFQEGENLFLANGAWDARYVPLAMAIRPFLIGRTAPDAEDAQVHIDMASSRIAGDEGVRVFDADGRPTPYLEDIADKLGALDAGWRGSEGFFAALRRHDLLEPFTFDVTHADGSSNRLVGFHVIDEGKLAALDASALADLHGEGHLMPIFMAVASLGQLGALIERRKGIDG